MRQQAAICTKNLDSFPKKRQSYHQSLANKNAVSVALRQSDAIDDWRI
jgi:hypothetical protein